MLRRKQMTASLIVLLVLCLVVACSNSGNNQQSNTPGNTNPSETPASGDNAAADNFNPTGLPIVKEPITVNMMYPRDPLHADFNDMWYFKEIAERTGIHIQVQAIERAGWEERKNLAFATQELPDLFYTGLTSNDENLFGSQGMLIDMSELIEQYAPTAVKLLEKYPVTRKTFSTEDGAIYVMPAFNNFLRDSVTARTMINKAWLDELRMDIPSNLDELYEVLKAFKANDATGNVIPMSGMHSGATKLTILSALGFVNTRHDVKDDKYYFVPIEPAYKEYLLYMNKLYNEGLLDREWFSQSREQVLAKEADMRIGVTGEGGLQNNIKDGEHKQYVMLPPITSHMNGELIAPQQPIYTRAGTFAITSKSKYSRELVRLLDYLYSPEASAMLRAGPEKGVVGANVGWEWTEADGVRAFTVSYEGHQSFWNFRHQHTPLGGPWDNGPYENGEMLGTYLTYADPQQAWLTNTIMDSGAVEVARPAYPEVKFTAAEQERIATFIDIENYAEQMEAKFIIGETSFSEWDNYLNTFKQMGVEEMISIRQAAYDRWNKN